MSIRAIAMEVTGSIVTDATLESALMQEVDEDLLVVRARHNDVRAYEQLYRIHLGRVHGLCRRLCGDREIAEDLAQEAFVLAWRKLVTFRGDSAFGSWLYRIATNVSLSYLRKQKHFAASLQLSENDEPTIQSDLDERMSLDKAIAHLPPGARAVFVLYSLEGYSHQEIADELKIAQGSSKAQLHRARKLLQGYLNREQP
jgi:RNA polymerase sigma-70 factor (ECF subfamily)